MARPERAELDETSSSTPPGFSLEPSSRVLKRRLGPVAWAVLEDVVLDAGVVDGHLVAATNVRRIAANLALSKDTAGRSVARLIAEGLVRRGPQRRQRAGCFGAVVYALVLPEGVHVRGVDAGVPRPTKQDTAVKPKRQPRRARAAQLTLLDDPPPINNNPNHQP
jgi:hypothetical protein